MQYGDVVAARINFEQAVIFKNTDRGHFLAQRAHVGLLRLTLKFNKSLIAARDKQGGICLATLYIGQVIVKLACFHVTGGEIRCQLFKISDFHTSKQLHHHVLIELLHTRFNWITNLQFDLLLEQL